MEQKPLFDLSDFTQSPPDNKAISPEIVAPSKRGSGKRSAQGGNSQFPIPNSSITSIDVSDGTNQIPESSSTSGDGNWKNFSGHSDEHIQQTLRLAEVKSSLEYRGVIGELGISPNYCVVHMIFVEGLQDFAIAVGTYDVRDAFLIFMEVIDEVLANQQLGCSSISERTLTKIITRPKLGRSTTDDRTLTKQSKGHLVEKTIKGTRQLYRRWREGGKYRSEWVRSLGPAHKEIK
ncbi:MAG: hypothetical protein F6K41_15175 [Symploca sp. SIO3E6]|nr:hypothetical protein [Caldora sp. SIO3E6]